MADPSRHLVLLAEDDPYLTEVCAEYLREVGFKVVTASTGRSAIAIARQSLPDVIVSDIMMGDGNGFYLLESLKRGTETHLIPFIFITARDSRQDIRQGMVLGADDYITKPFSMTELETAVRSQIEKQHSRTGAGAFFDQRYLTSMPHEMRTPLNGILGTADLLRDSLRRGSYPSPGELVENLDILHESGLRLLRLIENYLLFYDLRLAAAKPGSVYEFSSKATQFPPPDSFFSDLEKKHGRKGDIHFEMEVARVPVDQSLAEKAIFEIVDNALKFSNPRDPVHICGLAEKGRYTVTVADYGPGMTKEQIAGVSPFTQFDRDVLEQQGLGLGLCIVRLIADVCGLEMVLSSESGGGTRVSLTFPITDQPAPPPERP